MSGSTQTEGGPLTTTTPLRATALGPNSDIDGATFPYEAHLLRLLSTATDVSSSSDELELACASWIDGYHLSSARANVVRTLQIPPDATVLELGPAGGAVTRHLGETCAVVDAVEMDPQLATVAARRCEDLTSVQVFVGWVDDVPVAPAYDFILALDLLGEFRRHDTDLARFVAACGPLLAPGGVLVIGADNATGSRFLAGDASPIVRPGHHDRPLRTYRDEIERAVAGAGLVPKILSAFPDHRTARTLFDHAALAAIDPTLLTALPSFPSPPYDPPRSPDFVEERLWSEALEHGTGAESANSYVVLASVDGHASVAPATYWSVGRRAAFSTTNRITADGEGRATVHRGHTFPDTTQPQSPLHIRPHSEPVLRGTPLTDVLVAITDTGRASALLQAWSDLVERTIVAERPVSWDLIPRNVLVGPDGVLQQFDQEWQLEAAPRGADLVRSRGAFWLAYDLVFTRSRPDWLRGRTVGEAADYILRLANPDVRFDWHDAFVEDESLHMSYIWPTTPRHSQQARARRERNSVSSLSNTTPPDSPDTAPGAESGSSLRDVIDSLTSANADLRAEVQSIRMEQRREALSHRDHAVGLAAEIETIRERLARVQRESRRHKERSLRLQKQIDAMRESTSWRVGSRLVRPLASIGRKSRS